MSTPRWSIVGPTHPFRGGIPRHTTLFVDAAAEADLDVDFVTFTRQYPRWLYKGRTDRDPEQLRPTLVRPRPILDGVDPRTWWRVAGHVATHRPDVLVVVWWHPFFAPTIGTLLRRVRRLSPQTVQLALCHNVLPHEGSGVDRWLVRHALGPADGLVVQAVSEREVVRDVLGEVPVAVTPHPTYTVDVERARRDGDHTATLVFFGFIREYKGVDILLRALPAVLAKRRVRLVVAGEFWDPVDPYRELVRELDLEDHVELRPGYLPEGELPELLAQGDLMVAPYRTATQSGAVELARGAGLPVVASRVGGLVDQVDEPDNGLLVPPGDVEALSRALVEATEPATLARLTKGANARSSIRPWSGLVDDVKRFARSLRPGPADHEDVSTYEVGSRSASRGEQHDDR